ncbi:MAG: hypothetical protein WHT46_02425 [Candidatus Geothermincolales bacterium]
MTGARGTLGRRTSNRIRDTGLLENLVSERGSVASYLLKLIAPFIIVGFLISQAGPVVWNQIYTRTMASDAGDYALQVYRESNGNMEKVNAKVKDMVMERGGRLENDVSLISDAAGQPVALSLRVRRITSTLLFRRVTYLAPYTEARAEVMKEIK